MRAVHCRKVFESAFSLDSDTRLSSPGLISYGSPLALEDIQGESATWDGSVYDIFSKDTPKVVDGTVIRAVDGLQFAARDTLYLQFLNIFCLTIG